MGRYKMNWKIVTCILSVLLLLLILGSVAFISSKKKDVGDDFTVIETTYCNDPTKISIGVANINNHVSLSGTASIEENKQRILDAIEVFKGYDVNLVIFPEFSCTGYFWDDSSECWNYMKQGVLDRHPEWLAEVKSKLDDDLQYVIFNNIRIDPTEPDGKFLNSIYVVDRDFDCTTLSSDSNEQYHIYDKTFLPGIEKNYTNSGQDDYLVIDTGWGEFGFATCYDLCFTQLFQEYAMVDQVDGIIVLASWRGTGGREYPGMNVDSDHYYGYQWDLMTSSQAAFNQVWVIACNAVGTQTRGDYVFWGGSGLWSPSGMQLVQASHDYEELLVIRNVDIKGQTGFEHDDFWYYEDFIEVYTPIEGKRAFTRW